MKKAATWLGMLCLLWQTGCLDEGGAGASGYKGPLIRYHFIGNAHLPPGTNATVYRAIQNMPLTAEVRAEASQKLAARTLAFWKDDLPPGVIEQSVLLKPLLDDLLVSEVLLEVKGPVGRTESVLAIELSGAQAEAWNTKLRQLMVNWRLGAPHEATLEGFKGWEVKRAAAPNTLQFFRAGNWVLLGLGQDSIPSLAALLQEQRKSGRPLTPFSGGTILEFSANFPALRSWFPILARYPLPAVVASLQGRGENLRTEAHCYYSTPFNWKVEPWKIPTHVISEPLTSFTAAQGVRPLLSTFKGLAETGLNPLPNQLFSWGIYHEQYRQFFAAPIAGQAKSVIEEMALKLPKLLIASIPNVRGDFYYVSNRAEIIWSDMMFVQPYLRASEQDGQQYLVGGNFPPSAKHVPVPDELFNQFRGRTNLVYYDWEITRERLWQGKQFYQLACLVTGRSLPSTTTAAKRWVDAIIPKLSNTVTEVTRVGPQELSVVRRSHLGLTGFELASFSTWLDSPNFPAQFQLPPIIPWTASNSAALKLARATNAVSTNRAPVAPRRTNPPPPGAAPPPRKR